MTRRTIVSAGPSITEADVRAVSKAARDGWYENMSIYLDRFSARVCSLTKRRYCLPTSHGTAALHLAMIALDVKPGEEVIVPDGTWVATAACAKYVGARVRFADIDPVTWCICPRSAKKLITKKTRAVIAVNLFGTMAPMDELGQLCKRAGIALIEDAAESLGSTYHRKPSGSFGEISTLSFNATKLAMAGQGGAFLTDDEKLFKRAQLFSAHGIDKSINNRYYWSHVLGYNYRWTNIQAAFALSQLNRLDQLLKFKRQAFNWYKQAFAEDPFVQLNTIPVSTTSSYWLAVAQLSGPYALPKEKVERLMKTQGIDIRPFFYPISSMPPYRKDVRGLNMKKLNPVTYGISDTIICLPSSFRLTKSEAYRVARTLQRTLKQAAN